MDCKYEADKDLVTRTAFKWTIVRPGELKDDPAIGKVHLGKAHIGPVTVRSTSQSWVDL